MNKKYFLAAAAGIVIGYAQAQDSLQPRKIQLTLLGVGTETAQVAIIGNVATSSFKGAQVAGIFNTANKSVDGLQAAGVFNFVADTLKGAQLAGAFNAAASNVEGIQAAGSFNITGGNINGLQASGGANITAGDINRCQLAGGLNFGRDINGLQASGGANLARDVKGLQVSGGLNIATGTVKGLQASGGLNVARNVKGVQLGVVNLADSCSGASIGFFSFVRTGYHKIELGYNEALPLNFSFRTGSQRFYNIFSFGADFRPAKPYWSFGYGAGTSFNLHRRLSLDIDLTSHHVSQGRFATGWSDHYKLGTTLDFHVLNKVSLAVGPTLNVFVVDLHPGGSELPVSGFAPWYFFTQTYSNGINVKSWLGLQAAVRFL